MLDHSPLIMFPLVHGFFSLHLPPKRGVRNDNWSLMPVWKSFLLNFMDLVWINEEFRPNILFACIYLIMFLLTCIFFSILISQHVFHQQKYDFAFKVNYGFRHSLWCLCVIVTIPLSSPSHFLYISKSMKHWIFFSFWSAWNSKFSVRINVKAWLWSSRLEYRGIVSPHTRSSQNKQKPTEWNTGHSESKTPVWRTNNFQDIDFFLLCLCFKLCVRLCKGTSILQKVA